MINIHHYRIWARVEAEREYPILPIQESLTSPMNALVRREKRETYEAALLRMWPFVEALERISNTDPDDATAWFHRVSDEALCSLNLPRP